LGGGCVGTIKMVIPQKAGDLLLTSVTHKGQFCMELVGLLTMQGQMNIRNLLYLINDKKLHFWTGNVLT
jgi:hypothetical protein